MGTLGDGNAGRWERWAWERHGNAVRGGVAVDLRLTRVVTLYSGQFVAQSELSVVMTLAPDSGKWNVVYTTPGCIALRHRRAARFHPRGWSIPTQSPSTMPRSSASCGWISSGPRHASDCSGTARLRADVVLTQDAAGGQDQREAALDRSLVGTYSVTMKRPCRARTGRCAWSACLPEPHRCRATGCCPAGRASHSSRP
jgi:hypothetical protein